MNVETTNHNEIAGNIYAFLKLALRPINYKVYISGVRLWIPLYRQYTYPDVMVLSGEPIYAEKEMTTVMNPQLIIEVLSQSTQNYDQGDKFMYYRSIPAMKEYILIDQKRFYVMQYAKTDEGKWVLTEYDTEDSVLVFSSIESEILLRDLYEGVDFEHI